MSLNTQWIIGNAIAVCIYDIHSNGKQLYKWSVVVVKLSFLHCPDSMKIPVRVLCFAAVLATASGEFKRKHEWNILHKLSEQAVNTEGPERAETASAGL